MAEEQKPKGPPDRALQERAVEAALKLTIATIAGPLRECEMHFAVIVFCGESTACAGSSHVGETAERFRAAAAALEARIAREHGTSH